MPVLLLLLLLLLLRPLLLRFPPPSCQTTFERARMYHQPDCLGLMVAQLPAPDMSCQLEFSITGSSGSSKDGTSSVPSSSSDEESDVWTAAHLGSTSSSSGNNGGSSGGQPVVRDPPGAADQLYTAVHPGVWRLKDQQLNLDAAGQLAPLMLVGGPLCVCGGGQGGEGGEGRGTHVGL